MCDPSQAPLDRAHFPRANHTEIGPLLSEYGRGIVFVHEELAPSENNQKTEKLTGLLQAQNSTTEGSLDIPERVESL